MGLSLKKNMARIFTFMIVSVFSGILSQGAMAANSTCSPGDGSWPCFAAERAAKRVAKKSFRAKRALMRRAARKRARSRKKIRNARKYRRTLKASRSRKMRRSKNNSVLYINKNGKRISKRRATALALKRTRNRSRRARRNKNTKLRHLLKKKKSAYNRGFSLRGRHMRVTSRSIKTSCFPARLKRLISRVEKHYGKRLVVTSGFRSHAHNRRIGGASRSEHVHCKAVDFRIPGVNKYSLARFVKRLPGRGGVGTYCGKSTIHLDVGKRRTWNHCGKRKSRKRYAKRRKLRRSYRTTSSRRAQRARWNFKF